MKLYCFSFCFFI